MLELSNEMLTVQVLHPSDDVARMGSRYCHGGSVWQVVAAASGTELLSGPTYPAEPPTFDGQGLPEAFFPVGTSEDASLSAVPGVGWVTAELDPQQDGSGQRRGKVVATVLDWRITHSKTSLAMETEQDIGMDEKLRLIKTVILEGTTVTCRTEVELLAAKSQGTTSCELRWFAHPFFPLVDDGRVCTFAFDTSLEQSDEEDVRSFYYDGAHRLCMDHEYNWTYAEGGGSFKQLVGVTGRQLDAQAFHPHRGAVGVTGDFKLASMPIWANEKTVSFEPYYTPTLLSGSPCEWCIAYDFGAAVTGAAL